MSARSLMASSALVVLLLAGAAYLLWGRNDAETTREVERDSSAQIQRAVRLAVVPRVRPELSWMYERGIEPRRIAGRVTINGRPAADVEVSLRSEAMMHSELTPPTRRSNAEGRFDFGTWPVTQYAVVAGGGAYELAVAKVDLADPLVDADEVVVNLATCRREGFGTVTALYGEEIVGATLSVVVVIVPAARFIVASQPIEADGSFRLCLSSQRTDVRIDAPGFAQASLYEMRGHPMPTEGWRVQLLPAGSIRGTYVDSQGRGIAGGRVAIFRNGLSHHLSYLQHAITDAGGAFAFTAVGPGQYQVAVVHYDYMLDTDWQTVSLAPGEEKSGVIVTGGDCRKIAGTILTEDGAPIVGAHFTGALSQTDGSFVMSCEPFEAFELNSSEYQILTPLVPAGREDMNDLVVRVATPNSLGGRVLADGQPVPNAAVVLLSMEEGTMPFRRRASQRTRSDDSGQYRFASVIPGTYLMKASTSTGESDELSLQMSMSDLERDLTIEAGTHVSGTVSTEDGVHLSGIAVQFVSASGKKSSVTTEAEDGRFQILLSASESHQVSLRHQYSGRYEPPQSAPWPTLEAGARDLDLDLRIAGGAQTLSGKVVYEDNSPVANAVVRIVPTGRTRQTNEQGYFEFDNLPAAPYELYAKDLMGLKATEKGIVAVNGVARGVTVVIERGATIAGTVTDGTAACKSTLLGRDRRVAHGSTFSFDDLPPGEYTLEAQCDQGVASKSITVSPGARSELSLALEPGLSIDGIVKQFPSGEPIPNLECSAGMAGATTDSSGHFQFKNVAPLVTEIHCMRYERPLAFAQSALSASRGGRQTIDVWGLQSTAELETLTVESGRIGARLVVENDQLVFAEVDPSGECGQLGILNGDELSSVAGVAVHGINRVVEFYLQTLPKSESVEIEIRRGDARMTFNLGP